MTDDKKNQDRIRLLKERRTRLAEENEKIQNRGKNGTKIVNKVNSALIAKMTLEDFDTEREPPLKFLRKPDFRDCTGLVLAHTSETNTREFLSRCHEAIGLQDGLIGFDEYHYIGIASISSIGFLELLKTAKILHDSVYFWPTSTKAVVLVDHYKVSGAAEDIGFSVVIQGADLEKKLNPCL